MKTNMKEININELEKVSGGIELINRNTDNRPILPNPFEPIDTVTTR